MSMTTIKIDSALRDRLNAEARKRGVTAGSFVEELFEVWTREQRFAAMQRAMARAPDDTWASYRSETAALDALAADGLPPESFRFLSGEE